MYTDERTKLLDKFAAEAMLALIPVLIGSKVAPQEVASRAYVFAQAMMVERAKYLPQRVKDLEHMGDNVIKSTNKKQ